MAPAASLLPERLLVVSAVALTGILFLTTTADPVNVPKLAVLGACAALALGAQLARTTRNRVAQAPWGLGALAGGALALAFTVAALAAPRFGMAWHGAYGRNSGLMAYLAATILFLVVLTAFDAAATKLLLFAVLAAGLFTASYGLLQRLGIDSINWNNAFNPIIASLGNPDFASAYLGITVPAALWAACWTGWPVAFRIGSAVTAVFCLVVAAISSAVQGPMAAAAGTAILALGLALNLTGRRRRQALTGLYGVIGAGLVAVLAGAGGIGPARSFFSGIPWDSRTWYWQAAVKMWQRSPFTGVGLDAYGAYWRRDRPLASPRRLGGAAYSDSAHSVPLQHLAQGGLLLALAYLFFCGVIVVAMIRGLRRLEGQDRLLLAGLGGTWVAYQVQSLVSIDQVPLLIINFVVGAGVLVAAGSTTAREIRLPGAPAPATPGRGRKIKKPLRRATTPADAVLYTGIGGLVVVLLWLVLIPLRANHAVYAAAVDSASGDSATAVSELQHAVGLEPAVGNYRTKLGEQLSQAGRDPDAQRAYAAAFEVDATEVNAGLLAADMAVQAGDNEGARRLFDRALVMDPSNGATILRWAAFTREHGDAKTALARLERATRDLPGEVLLWATLGDVRLAAGDTAGARAAYDQALVVDPTHKPAQDALKKLDAQGG